MENAEETEKGQWTMDPEWMQESWREMVGEMMKEEEEHCLQRQGTQQRLR